MSSHEVSESNNDSGYTANIALEIFNVEKNEDDEQCLDNEVEQIMLNNPECPNGVRTTPQCPSYTPVEDWTPVFENVTLNGDQEDEPQPKKKRSLSKENWDRNIRKACANKGLAYRNSKSQMVPAKTMGPLCKDTCFHKCSEKFSQEKRHSIFASFYELGDKSKQWDFLNHYVVTSEKKTSRPNSKRTCTRYYYLPDQHDPLLSPKKVRVCCTFFQNTLAVTHNWIETAANKLNRTHAIISPDRRGRYKRTMSPTSQLRVNGIRQHIESFPKVPSHYCRTLSSRLYLDAELNVASMYRLYVDWMAETYPEQTPANERKYRDCFNTEFNLSFFSPRKDQCNVCLAYDNATKTNSATDEMRSKYETHRVNREIGRNLKAAEKERVAENPNLAVACYDFQKVLQTPHTEASLGYYKRKLAVYNFTLYDMGNREGHCYAWDETTASKGANEVASSLELFFKIKIQKGITEFSLFSDNCAGQNRNRYVFGMYARMAKIHGVTITHRFLESGHTQMEADSVHATIERAKNNIQIFVPQQWYAVMAAAKKKGQPYIVHELSQDDFFDHHDFVDRTYWARNSENEKVMWGKVREVKVTAEQPNVFLYKQQFNEDFKQVILYSQQPPKPVRKRKGAKINGPFDFTIPLPPAYTRKLAITTAKYKDLKSLCEANVIPKSHHQFYLSLGYGDQDDETDDIMLDEFFLDPLV